MEALEISSIVGLMIQCAGVMLATLLSVFIRRSIRRKSFDYWTIGWVFLCVALSALVIGFRFKFLYPFTLPTYFLCEYGFGYMLVAGCRNYAAGKELRRSHLILLLPASAIAIALARIWPDFNSSFIPHAALMSLLFATALIALAPARRRGPGARVMSVALLLLAIDFLHYIPLFIYVQLSEAGPMLGYLHYTSIYDLILETLLAFGAVIVGMEDMRREAEEANAELIAARDRLEVMARLDPLTEALNRHAFYSMIETEEGSPTGSGSGTVVIVDVDDLKTVNDSFGHTAGDAAIRAVAKAIRSIIRPDDLLFRWGGDEFVVILLGVPEKEVRKRLTSINAALSGSTLPGVGAPVGLAVSWGLASFESIGDIESAIENADNDMYASKDARKTQKLEMTG